MNKKKSTFDYEPHPLATQSRNLTIHKHMPHKWQRTDALKFLMLQIAIIAKVPPNGHFYLRVRLQKRRFVLTHYARNLASVKKFILGNHECKTVEY